MANDNAGNRKTGEDSQVDPAVFDDAEAIEIDFPDDVQKVLFYSIDEATKVIETGEELVPFTMVLAGEDLFMDSHPVDEVDECFASARQAVNAIAHIADAYVFCYDGYFETDDGEHDMLIAEVGMKGQEQGVAYGLIYELEMPDGEDDEASASFDEGLLLLGDTDNLFDPEAVRAAEALQEAYANYDQEGEAE